MANVIAAIEALADVIIAKKEFLTELDAAIGDADHGINMARGFEAVRAKLAAANPEDIGGVLKLVGMTLISTVGGASGPLYGTAFMRAAVVTQGKAILDAATIAQMLSAAIGGIKDRGKAVRGEKTMLDALEPAYEAFIQAMDKGESLSKSLQAATKAAADGVEYTKTIIATKGRASYLGERSIGHQDAGATSTYLMLSALTAFAQEQSQAV
ncbi:dihydroxyacetone kinase subunit DhaL [Sporomusa acidovorans]|uniref:PEP-dependent dihydroxyacetone kinase, ADP-binding subunit DhaL n=1 Tax=Sporomusa acidovorans (strain ATCC 49682 / DSM 3132 / Mol) TaxID=1123286 RepID=A0ABZ3JC64_SPOA4|nr:dihydroxyacetone kinase subunit DhaL [Sporomusa acidovorans]OZC22706.1 PTS-dependent dihydroxyacetone kinase, ADP-binding subunit DhaL [Sporomusa acidovorans DSM 3132]SDE79371.1 dihydroxyacetone kinase DhaL subunit [Sporomusa acidovorans]